VVLKEKEVKLRTKWWAIGGILILGILIFGAVGWAATITMKSGTFGDVSFHKVDSSAVNSYKATVADIIAGTHTDDTEFAPEEICIYSDANGYVNGGSMYIPSVLEGLSENDIIKRVTNSYVHDSSTGGSFINWSTKEEYYKVTDYTHTDTDTIYNWLGYGTKNDDGTFTWVLGHGLCDASDSVPDRAHLLTLLSQHYETKNVTIYRGATLEGESTDSRGYIKGTGVSGGTVAATFNYQCPILNVVDTITVGASGCDYTEIQAAIDAACSDGNTIKVATGTYDEQLLVDSNDLTIQAASTPVITGVSNAEYIIKVTNADVTLDGLTVDGTGNNIKYGIWYYDNGSGTTSGTITNCTVENIEKAEGKDIRIENSPVDITNNTIKEFAKDGIFVRDSLSTGTISGNEIILRTIDGVNEVQYGVQVGWGADVTIQNNTIYDSTIASVDIYDWNWASSGIFVVDSTAGHGGSKANIITNHIHHCMEGVHIGYQYVLGDTSYGLIQDNNIHDCFWCVGVVGDASADIENNTIEMLDADVKAFVEGYGEGIFVGGSWSELDEHPTAVITNNTIDNFDMGIDIYEFANVTITGNDITNNDYGIYANAKDGETWAQTVVAHFNNIVGNSEYGVDNSANSATFDATNNYWGDDSGPSGGVADPATGTLANGTGDAVSANVLFDPWTGMSTVNVVTDPDVKAGDPPVENPDAEVSVTIESGTGSTAVTIAEYTGNPAGTPSFGAGERYIDVQLSNPGAVTELTITFDGMAAGTMIYFYRPGTGWIACSNQTYASGTISVTVTDSTVPTLTELLGGIFAEGSAPGDINGDGAINVLDARLCLQIATGFLEGTATQRAAADVDGDGDVDFADAEWLAKYIIHIIAELGGE